MNFRAVWLIASKEWKESFNSPMPYVFLVVFYLVAGWFWVASLFLSGQAALDDFLSPLPILLCFFLPAFSMRLFAEEYKTGTIEPLSTLPLRDAEVVLGKYLAVWGLWAGMLAVAGFYAAVLFALGRPDPGQMAAGFLGALLLGGLYSAAGLFASSLTRSQVVGFILGFLFCFAVFLAGKMAQFVSGPAAQFLSFLGVDAHFEAFLRGVVDTRDVVYFLSGMLLFLAGTLASFNSRRWR
ncbi:MAG: ABC transporter permease subunit [Elusimicrobiota bacterium]